MRLFVRCGCKFSEAQKQDQCCILAQNFSLCGNLLARFFSEPSFSTRIHSAVKYQARNCRKECAECAYHRALLANKLVVPTREHSEPGGICCGRDPKCRV